MSTIYLYVKQHKITGLKYFGMTRKKDPFSYKGSGKRWVKHLKKHGASYYTLSVWGFDSLYLCSEFAMQFSNTNNIVESKDWANLIPENCIRGGVPGTKHTNETKRKISENHKDVSGRNNPNYGKSPSLEVRLKQSARRTGTKATYETKQKMSRSRQNRTITHETGMKISASLKNKPKSDEHKKKLSQATTNNYLFRLWSFCILHRYLQAKID